MDSAAVQAVPSTLAGSDTARLAAPARAARRRTPPARTRRRTDSRLAAGYVYTWGSSESLVLGYSAGSVQQTPRRVPALSKTPAISVSCSPRQTIVVSDGDLYMWGTLSGGIAVPEPVRITLPEGTRVAEAECGQSHALALTESGVLFAWGDQNRYGQLGLGDTSANPVHRPQPVRLASSDDCSAAGWVPVSVACGADHSVCLAEVQHGSATHASRVFVWGHAGSGRLGLGRARGAQLSPVLLPPLSDPSPVAEVACGYYHTILVTANGAVFTFGKGEHGMLGHGNVKDVHRPVAVEALSREHVVCVAAGAWHSLAVTAEGTVFSWGRGDSGQLGTGDTTDRHTPQFIESLAQRTIFTAAAGGAFSAILTKSGALFTCGIGIDGQLGHRPAPASILYPRRVRTLRDQCVFHVSCGAWHMACCVLAEHFEGDSSDDEGEYGEPVPLSGPGGSLQKDPGNDAAEERRARERQNARAAQSYDAHTVRPHSMRTQALRDDYEIGEDSESQEDDASIEDASD